MSDWPFLDYDLPDELIAQTPLEDRAASRLLYLHRESNRIEDRSFRDVIELLHDGDVLVLNDTRVTALRLVGHRPSGGSAELLVLRGREDGTFEALARPAKRLKPATIVEFEGSLVARVVDDLGEGKKLVRFEGAEWNLQLQRHGRTPLPPYIRANLANPERYQTVYSDIEQSLTGARGSAAAPTAGLHFTPAILESLESRGVEIARVTLDVGFDTFRPISTEDPMAHVMHGEFCSIGEEAAATINKAKGRIVAVGTTAVRTLESMAVGEGRVEAGSKETRIFIKPGYEFRVVEGMFTNFHMPRTTMLLMLAALASPHAIQAAYRHAITHKYRFLSFGDSMLIL